MSDFTIINTDDEEDYNESYIYSLCQENLDLIDIEKIILNKEKEGRRKAYIKENYKDIIEDINIGKSIMEKFFIAEKTQTPIELIFKDKEANYFSVKEILHNNKEILSALKFFRNEYSITIDEFLFSYYISNIDKSDNFLLTNLNSIKNISGKEFLKEEWDEKKKAFDNLYNNRLEILSIKYKKIKDFYGEINDIPFLISPEKLNKSFNLDKTKVNVKIKKDKYYFEKDSGLIIFEELKASKHFPYIQYNSCLEKYYKIYDKLNFEDFMVVKDKIFKENIEEDDDDTDVIYILNYLEIGGKINYILLIIDLETSSLTFEYPLTYSDKIYEDIKNFLIPNIIYSEETIKSVNGSFEITIENYSVINFYYLIFFDKKFSNFIYLNESKRPRSLMKNVKYYYKNYDDSYLSEDYILTFNIENNYSNNYIVKFKSKFEEKNQNVKEFVLIFSKLLYYYKNYDFENTDLPIIKNPYTGKDGNGLGDNYVEKETEIKTSKSNKLNNLLTNAPEIFPSNSYGRKCICPNQPIIVQKEDLKDWEGHLDKDAISIFPPVNSVDKEKNKYIFACPTNNLVFNYIFNPDEKSPFPILPCCGQTSKNDLYEDYDEIKEDPTKYKGSLSSKKSNVSKTIKKGLNPVSSGEKGNLPPTLKDFLYNIYPNKKFLRYGLDKNSRVSLLHCCLYASKHLKYLLNLKINDKFLAYITFLTRLRDKYLNLDITKKDLLILKLRKDINNNEFNPIINKEVAYQELFNFNKFSIDFLLGEKDLDSFYFYKLLEYCFFLNIFVFSFKDGNISLEKPNHNHYHQREIRDTLPSIIIIKNQDYGSFPVYELVIEEKGETLLVEEKFLNAMKVYIYKNGYYITSIDNYTYKTTENYYNNINWNLILKNYLIVGQFLNDSGRAYALNVQYSEDKKDIMTIFIPNSFPLNAPETYKIYKVEKSIATKLFGNDFVIGSEGIWYSINDTKLGVFIPILGSKILEKNVCQSYITIEKRSKGIIKFKKINNIKKNSKIIIQIIIWLWSISEEENLKEWFDYYVSYGVKQEINSVCNEIINVEYRFPVYITNIVEGIQYYSEYIPSVFGRNTIFLYEELRNHVYQHLENYTSVAENNGKNSNKAIINIFNSIKDFTPKIYNTIIIGEKNFEDWYNKINYSNKSLSLENNLNRRAFTYKTSNGKIYIIQNTEDSSIKTAILISKIWSLIKINLGYSINLINIWKFIKKNKDIIPYLNLDTESIISLANSYSSRLLLDIKTLDDALDFLYRDKIELEIAEKDYDYITVNYMKYINKENKKSENYYTIYSYSDEKYAAMLDIS